MPEIMAKRRTNKKTDASSAKRYPSRENTRYAGMPLELFKELEQIGEPLERSVSYLTRKAVQLWLKLRELEDLLSKIEPEEIPRLRKALEEIVAKK